MREIKFRAKSLDTEEWVYGHYFETGIHECGWIVVPDFEGHPELSGNPVEDLTCTVAVDKETVGQFTGLHDKNGKEIYEGDILHYDDPSFGYKSHVFFDEACYWIEDKNPMMLTDEHAHAEVCGNIHDTTDSCKACKRPFTALDLKVKNSLPDGICSTCFTSNA